MPSPPTSADYQKLIAATNASAKAMEKLAEGLRALNINLVALHEVLKETPNE